MSRRRRERALAPRGTEPIDKERALARFTHLVGRSMTFGFVPYGPVVEAETPEQLVERLERVLVAEGGRQRTS